MGNGDVASMMEFPWTRGSSAQTEVQNESEAFARLLVAGTIEHVAEIDEVIKRHLDSWDFKRINKVDLAILRISVYPLLYQKDLHPSIVICLKASTSLLAYTEITTLPSQNSFCVVTP